MMEDFEEYERTMFIYCHFKPFYHFKFGTLNIDFYKSYRRYSQTVNNFIPPGRINIFCGSVKIFWPESLNHTCSARCHGTEPFASYMKLSLIHISEPTRLGMI